MNDTLSKPVGSLRLISGAEQQFAMYALDSRIPRKYASRRRAEDEALPEDVSTKASIYGATLLSGILYCAHCGHRLVGGYCTKQRAHAAYHRPIYRCYNGSVKAKNCTGQSVYSARKIEEAVLETVQRYFQNMTGTVDAVWREQARIQLRSKQGALLKASQAELAKLHQQQTRLRQEVLKSLSGESAFDTELLKSMLTENAQAIADAEARVEQHQAEQAQENERISFLAQQYHQIADWADEFSSASNDTKKMILARIIEKITVDRDYHITITFFITREDFFHDASSQQSNVAIAEAEHGIYQHAASSAR